MNHLLSKEVRAQLHGKSEDPMKCRYRFRTYYEQHKRQIFDTIRGYGGKLRLKIMMMLSIEEKIKCNRCGFDDIRALQIDHIEGIGKDNRKKFKNQQLEWLYYLKNPELMKKDLQVLCANCNWIKRNEKKEYNHIRDLA